MLVPQVVLATAKSPAALAEERSRAVVPRLVTVTGRRLLVRPTLRLPNARPMGETVRGPDPVPLRGTIRGLFAAS
jgi:hypothetical protein